MPLAFALLSLVFAVLACTTGGCSTSDSSPDGAAEVSLQLGLRNLPARVGGTAWMWLTYPDGTKSEAVSAPAEPFSDLIIAPKTAPFNVTAYLPDAESWKASDAPAAGYYAVKSGVADAAEPLRVSHWIHSDELYPKDNGIKHLDEEDRYGTVSGTVSDDQGQPIERAMVWVDDQRVALTDAAGQYSLELLTGSTIFHVAADGTTEHQEEIDIAEGTTFPKTLALKVNPAAQSIAYPFQLLDRDTGLPVPFATLNAFNQNRSYTADANGVVMIDSKGPVFFGEIRATGYAYASGVFYLRAEGVGPTMTAGLFPLVQGFYGTWSYCFTTALGRDWRHPTKNGTQFVMPPLADAGGIPVSNFVMDHTWKDDGTFTSVSDGVGQLLGLYWQAALMTGSSDTYSFALPKPANLGMGSGIVMGGQSGWKLEGSSSTVIVRGSAPGDLHTQWLRNHWSKDGTCPNTGSPLPDAGTDGAPPVVWAGFCKTICSSGHWPNQTEQDCVANGTPPPVLEFAGGGNAECESLCASEQLIKLRIECTDYLIGCIQNIWCSEAQALDAAMCTANPPSTHCMPTDKCFDLVRCDGKNVQRMHDCLPATCVP